MIIWESRKVGWDSSWWQSKKKGLGRASVKAQARLWKLWRTVFSWQRGGGNTFVWNKINCVDCQALKERTERERERTMMDVRDGKYFERNFLLIHVKKGFKDIYRFCFDLLSHNTTAVCTAVAVIMRPVCAAGWPNCTYHLQDIYKKNK